MNARERALQVGRRSTRVRRLLASTIQAAARLNLRVLVTQGEAEALAHDYLPTDAVEQIRRNRDRRDLRNLPDGCRDRGVVTTTILEGATRREWRDPGWQGASGTDAEHPRHAPGWTHWLPLKWRAWQAGRDVRADIKKAYADEQAHARRTRVESLALVDSVGELGDRVDDGIECLRLRVEYAAKLRRLGLTEQQEQEAILALDRTINYHLQFVLR